MIKKEYKYGADARQSIKTVSSEILKRIGRTMGPAGRNAFLPTGITNDGRTILSEIRFPNECDDQTVLAYHEVARQQDNDSGDGTSTATVISSKLALDVIEHVPDVDTPIPGSRSLMELSRALEEEKDKAVELLSQEIVKKGDELTLDDLKKVSYTAMEDKETGDIIAEAIFEGGKNCYPIIKEGVNEKIEKEVIKGIDMPFHIATTEMFNSVGKAELKRCKVLVVNHMFEDYLELSPFMQSMLKEDKSAPLVIIAKNFSIDFIQYVRMLTQKTGFPIILLQNKYIHEDTFHDIASYVDANYIDTHPKTGKNIADVRYSDCGEAEGIIAREKSVQIIDGRGLHAVKISPNVAPKSDMQTRVTARVDEIKRLLAEETDKKERDKMENRMASLQSGIICIYVDAKTAAEKYYKKLKVEDAMNSCRSALNGGIVVGGAEALRVVGEKLGDDSLLSKALQEPARQISVNNGGNGFDLDGVYEAFLVDKTAIENAVSVIKTLITIDTLIADKDEDLVDNLSSKLGLQE